MTIPEQAVEAAARALCRADGNRCDGVCKKNGECRAPVENFKNGDLWRKAEAALAEERGEDAPRT